jgi:hypothetical protein
VIAGLTPHFAWRLAMGVAGVALYSLVVRRAAGLLLGSVENRQLSARDVERLTVLAYLAGSIVTVAASLLNPISLGLVGAAVLFVGVLGPGIRF